MLGVRKKLFRLRTILLLVLFMVMVLPLGSFYFFRIYENELIQQTERELISQAAALAASFKGLAKTLQSNGPIYGKLLPNLPPADGKYHPITPSLSLINPIQPRRPIPQIATEPVDAIAAQLGALLIPIMLDTQRITLSGMRLLDIHGAVIAGKEENGLSLAHIPEVRQALQGRYASVIRQRISDEPPPPLYSMSRGTAVRVFVALPIVEGQYLQGVLYLSRTPENIIKHLYAAKEKVLLVSVFLLILVLLLGMLVSSAISKPIKELIQQTHRIRLGEQKQLEILANPITYEMAQLSESFATLSQALNERSDYLRRFATHMSHEFKTPLTSMQGALELLQDHLDTMPKAQQLRFLDNLLADTLRLKQLVNRLLELARADALEASPQTCHLREVLKSLQSQFTDRGLHLDYSDLIDATLLIAPDVLEMALYNLLENSVQHQATQVRITSQQQSQNLSLQLHDNGSGISNDNFNKVFTPFFTTRRNSGGTGLGLAITMSLLKAYNGQLQLLPCGQGAVFQIRCPRVHSQNMTLS